MSTPNSPIQQPTQLHRRIIEECCKGNRAHYDLGLAREMQLSSSAGRGGGASGDYLVLHLPELVRVAFMAATSDADQLRLEGLQTLEVTIRTSHSNATYPQFYIHTVDKDRVR